MSIAVRKLTLGMVSTNAYLIGDTVTKNAILIDPVDEPLVILKSAEEAGWTIKLILATHAHFDHVLASHALKEATNAPFVIHQDCVKWLEILPQQGRRFGVAQFPEAAVPDRLLTNASEEIVVDGIVLQTLYTPGHAEGHESFFMASERILFSGDCLFAGSIGRTDLPGGNYTVLMESIMNTLMPLGDDVKVMAGHMEDTTLGKERRTNPFVLDYDNR